MINQTLFPNKLSDDSELQRHYELAQKFFQEDQYFQAVALYRTYMCLSNKIRDDVCCRLANAYYQLGLYSIAAQSIKHVQYARDFFSENFLSSINSKAYIGDDGLTKLSHHTYIRLKLLADHIRTLYPENLSTIRLLDIGGGTGYLACFLPEIQYVLADPSVNGISALNLPFQSNSFDCVVACHVLEHIEDASKSAFMDNLCSLARSHVVLLNPFLTGNDCADSFADEILQMGWEITGAPWAKEHLDSGLPSLDFIKEYTRYHQYPLSIAANNSYAFTALYVLMEHFALVANKTEEFKKINKLFNRMDPEMMSNASFPNDFTCVIDVRDQEKK